MPSRSSARRRSNTHASNTCVCEYVNMCVYEFVHIRVKIWQMHKIHTLSSHSNARHRSQYTRQECMCVWICDYVHVWICKKTFAYCQYSIWYTYTAIPRECTVQEQYTHQESEHTWIFVYVHIWICTHTFAYCTYTMCYAYTVVALKCTTQKQYTRKYSVHMCMCAYMSVYIHVCVL